MELKLPRFALIFALAAASAWGLAQEPDSSDVPAPGSQNEVVLPSGKLQRDEILRVEREQNIRDAGRLVEMAQELKAELEKDDRFVLSMSTLKKTDDIEKLVKKIRTRLRH